MSEPDTEPPPFRRRPETEGNDTDSARELREKKRVLAALVVHDLRSPLSASVAPSPLVSARRGFGVSLGEPDSAISP